MKKKRIRPAHNEDGSRGGMSSNIFQGAYYNNIEAVKIAILADPYSIFEQDENGDTAFHIASRSGNLSIVQYLLQQSYIDLSLKNREGQDAIDVAINTGHSKIISLFFNFRGEQLGLLGPSKKSKINQKKLPKTEPS